MQIPKISSRFYRLRQIIAQAANDPTPTAIDVLANAWIARRTGLPPAVANAARDGWAWRLSRGSSAMSALPVAIRPRIAQIVRLLASPIDGQALSAVRAVGRALAAYGASFHDLAEAIDHEPAPRLIYEPQTPPNVHPAWGNSARSVVRMKLERAIQANALTTWERDFAASVVGQIAASWSWRSTPKQEQHIDAIIAKLNAAGDWA